MRAYRHIRAIDSQELVPLVKHLLGDRKLLVASNRGPVQFTLDKQKGTLRRQRGAGGVVTALSALGKYVGIVWVASTMGEGDRRAAESYGPLIAGEGEGEPDLRFVCPSPEAYHKYYDIFSNPLLWFLHHYMWDPAYDPIIDKRIYDAWQTGYRPVNDLFAEAIAGELNRPGSSRLVMLHDYQLYLVARALRARCPDVVLQQFVHIPWPEPAYWSLLPGSMRQSIFDGVTANNILGFQTTQSATNFLQGCQVFLEDAEVDWRRREVRHCGITTAARVYPISLDVQGLRRAAESREVQRYVERLRPLLGKRGTIVRVDRLEPSKNILRGFEAFDQLLATHREYRGTVKFLAFLVPSRTNVREYRTYYERVMQIIERINTRWGRDDWKPIELFYENNYAQAIAAMKLYDALLVNPIIDGMNLVAKEGPTVNTRDGVLILSEGAGAYEQLRDGSSAVAPADVFGTTQALHEALTMPAEDRARRATFLRNRVAEEDIGVWLLHQFRDLAPLLNDHLAHVPATRSA